VFVQGGSDRVEEFVWQILAYELFQRANELKLKGDVVSALQEFHQLLEKRATTFKKRVVITSESPLSPWDQEVIAAEGASPEIVFDSITAICTFNNFALSWHEACTNGGTDLLEGLFELALKLAAEDTSGRLIFSADTLPFPSSWELDLETSLAKGLVVSP